MKLTENELRSIHAALAEDVAKAIHDRQAAIKARQDAEWFVNRTLADPMPLTPPDFRPAIPALSPVFTVPEWIMAVVLAGALTALALGLL